MRITVQLRWSEAQNHYESLAVSLRAILAGNDADRPYDELLAALGLGAVVVASAEDSLGWWCTYARDAGLIETAALYGLQLRELHPPEATAGLGGSQEYAQHFRDSYVPLIVEALAHDQFAIAWRGWPAPRDHLWGVIASVQDGVLFGHTLWHEGRSLPLTGPAFQIYLVEQVEPPPVEARSPERLFRHVALQACHAWEEKWTAVSSIDTGPRAYLAWQEALRQPASANASAQPVFRQHSQATRVLMAARSSLASWLRRVGGALPGDYIDIAAHWAGVCDRIAERLVPYESADVVREVLTQPGGVGRICQAIKDVSRLEAGVVAELKKHLGMQAAKRPDKNSD